MAGRSQPRRIVKQARCLCDSRRARDVARERRLQALRRRRVAGQIDPVGERIPAHCGGDCSYGSCVGGGCSGVSRLEHDGRC